MLELLCPKFLHLNKLPTLSFLNHRSTHFQFTNRIEFRSTLKQVSFLSGRKQGEVRVVRVRRIHFMPLWTPALVTDHLSPETN